MTGTITSGSNALDKRRTYRRLLAADLAVAVGGSLALRSLGYPLVGEGLYLLGVVGFLAIWWGTPVTLFDERDVALERRASTVTLGLFAFVLVGGASALRILSALGAYTVSPMVEGALYGYAAQFLVFGLVYVALRFRP